MQPKPLTKDEREILRKACDANNVAETETNRLIANALRRILESEQFWREAVKNAREASDIGPSAGMAIECNFCYGQDTTAPSGVSGDGVIVHKPGCPYLLAQESVE